jgi:hypothetical protein
VDDLMMQLCIVTPFQPALGNDNHDFVEFATSSNQSKLAIQRENLYRLRKKQRISHRNAP